MYDEKSEKKEQKQKQKIVEKAKKYSGEKKKELYDEKSERKEDIPKKEEALGKSGREWKKETPETLAQLEKLAQLKKIYEKQAEKAQEVTRKINKLPTGKTRDRLKFNAEKIDYRVKMLANTIVDITENAKNLPTAKGYIKFFEEISTEIDSLVDKTNKIITKKF